MSKSYRKELIGLFGCPIDENPTVVIEEAGFKHLSLPYTYLNILVKEEDLEAAVSGIRAFNMRGANCTIPHKVNVIKYLDEISDAAKIIGAVNTIVNDDGYLRGENTDGKGYMISLKDENVNVEGAHVVLLGAGGAARAISVECALAGAKKVTIVNRTVSKAEEIAAVINKNTKADASAVAWDGTYSFPEDANIIINATSIGLFPDVNEKPDVDFDSIRKNMVVSDVIPNDPNTLFLKEAEKRGNKVINGLGMLVNQAALNFKLWTGEDAPVEVMEKAIKKEFDLL